MTSRSGHSDAQRAHQPSLWLKLPAVALWGMAIVFNTVIALFLTAIDYGGSLMVNWVFSQCIGLTITALVALNLSVIHVRPWRAVGLGLAVVVGSMLGTGLALVVTGVSEFDTSGARAFWQAVFIGLVFGAGVTMLAFYRERTLRSEQALDAERLKLLQGEKAQVETELRLLQAQVEPHFLFNTLAILRGLIGRDPLAGKQLLDHLIDYLRASLSHSRCDQATLGEELALLDSYLTIMQFRMGERLTFSIKIADELRSQPLAPMLLQPLVENAIRHGLEPKTGPGRVWITVSSIGDAIQMQVGDDGMGFSNSGSAGTGLANIRARLTTLYEGRAALTLEDNDHGGVTATLRVPRT